ncbi:MAG: hypothetical protein QM811_26315 [Pirellulales bacterium]
MQPNYDEDRESTRYVWNHFQDRMTEFEKRIGSALFWRERADLVTDSRVMIDMLRNKGEIGVVEVDAALSDGHEAYRRKVRDRLLADLEDPIVIHRCGRCRKVLRTPLARQCLWCGYDWHGSDESPILETR